MIFGFKAEAREAYLDQWDYVGTYCWGRARGSPHFCPSGVSVEPSNCGLESMATGTINTVDDRITL